MQNISPFSPTYNDILSKVMYSGLTEKNARTGVKIRMLGIPCSFIVDLRSGELPVPSLRRVFPKTAAAETAWCLRGEKNLAWLQKYCKIWDKFAEEDNTVEAAYGYRWARHFGRDQIGSAVRALIEDPTSRQVHVSAWDPSEDGLMSGVKKNVPCPTCFTVNVSNRYLNMALHIRSSDVFVGLPYDVMGYALLVDAMAASLGYTPGFLHVTLAHPHVYEPHWSDAIEGLRQVHVSEELMAHDLTFQSYSHLTGPQMPAWPISRIVGRSEEYVERVYELCGAVAWPEFNPRPEVVE